MTEPKPREWPLVVFTLATQFACGLALVCTLAEISAGGAQAARLRPLGVAVFPVIAAGILCSLAHLGQPLDAWKAFLNLGQSRLSRELLVTALFAVFALAYGASWFAPLSELRVGLGLTTAVCGLATVLSSAAIYTIPAQPFWNAGWLPLSFVGTTLLLGGAAGAVWAPARELFGCMIVGGVLVALAAVWMWQRAAWASPRQQFALAVHVILAGILPAAAVTFEPAPVAFAAIVLGAVIGRTMMYSLGSAAPRF